MGGGGGGGWGLMKKKIACLGSIELYLKAELPGRVKGEERKNSSA